MGKPAQDKHNVFSAARQLASRIPGMRFSLHLRLFLLFTLLGCSLLLCVLVLLSATGNLSSGDQEAQLLAGSELYHVSEKIAVQYDQLAAQAIEYAKEISLSMEKALQSKGYTPKEIAYHPEALEELLSLNYEHSLFMLQRSKGSGVFIILDATVNPTLENAMHSRAGLYIKNMEPNILSASSPNILMLRGPSAIGRQNGATLHSQWSMEFDVSEASYFSLPMAAARANRLPLSRLYYWTPPVSLPGTTEDVMLCSVPLVDSAGEVFGVCGLEISAMLFKLSNMPDITAYSRLFCLFAPCKMDEMDVSRSFFAGGYFARDIADLSRPLLADKKNGRLFLYHQTDGGRFRGMHQTISLYPEGSVFGNQQWAAAILIPEADVITAQSRHSLSLTLLFGMLLVLTAAFSYYFSVHYLSPIKKSFEQIKANDFSQHSSTKITELDDLIAFLSAHRRELWEGQADSLPPDLFDAFLSNVKTLSPAERAVFNLYLEGYNAREIAAKLFLSINTIKTHSRRIYTKMNVSSRDELTAYITLLKDAGKTVE